MIKNISVYEQLRIYLLMLYGMPLFFLFGIADNSNNVTLVKMIADAAVR